MKSWKNRIWPNALSQGEMETADIELAHPVELVTV
jgi:hypothetical protein